MFSDVVVCRILNNEMDDFSSPVRISLCFSFSSSDPTRAVPFTLVILPTKGLLQYVRLHCNPSKLHRPRKEAFELHISRYR